MLASNPRWSRRSLDVCAAPKRTCRRASAAPPPSGATAAGGSSGEESVKSHAAFMDGFLRLLFDLSDAEVRRDGHRRTPLVLVALGGYGRGELHPSSDLDLMLVHGGEVAPYVQRMAQEILYTLWDLGLRVGHACRSR